MPYVKPALAGAVVTDPAEVQVEELRWKTVTANALPGRFVKRDTTDSEIQLATSGDTGVYGIVLLNPTKDSTVAAIAGEWARVGHGAGNVVVGVYDFPVGGALTKGDALYVGLTGKGYKAAGTDPTKLIGYAEETLTASGNIMIRLAK